MVRVMLFVVLALLPFTSAFGIGPVDVSATDLDNKKFWDNAIVFTGLVEKVNHLEDFWVVVSVKPTGTISGTFDPASCLVVKIGFQDSLLNHFPTPRQGDKIIAITRRKPVQRNDDDQLTKPEHGDFGLHSIRVVADKSIGPISILDERSETRVEALLERIRGIRAYREP